MKKLTEINSLNLHKTFLKEIEYKLDFFLFGNIVFLHDEIISFSDITFDFLPLEEYN